MKRRQGFDPGDALAAAKTPTLFCRRQETVFGPLAVLWSFRGGEAGIDRIVLPATTAADEGFPVADAGSPPIDDLMVRLAAYCNGEAVRFPREWFRLESCSAFQRQVLLALSAVPRGFVTTYRFLAERVGSPLAVRAVGTALATNPFPLVIPCHRTVRSDGTLGGYAGGLAMKRALLEREGIAFAEGRGGTVRVEGHFIVRPPDD